MKKSLGLLILLILGFCALTITGHRTTASSTTSVSQDPQKLAEAKTASVQELLQRSAEFGITQAEDLKVRSVALDHLAMTHTRVQQHYQGVPVFGGEAIVHHRKDGAVAHLSEALVKNVSVIMQPSFAAAEAINRAVAMYSCPSCLTDKPQADLWILRRDGVDHLVYRVQMRRLDGSRHTTMPVYFIDAHTGTKVWEYDNLQTGFGSSNYSGGVTIGTRYYQGPNYATYYLEDLPRKIGTWRWNNSRFLPSDPFYFSIESTTDGFSGPGVDAHWGVEKAYDYYQTVFGRTGMDNFGGYLGMTSVDRNTRLISAVVNYGVALDTAFWDGSNRRMVFGDGGGFFSGPLVSLDIVAHEFTHGVTQATAGLIYQGESGALNESMSDVFGAMVERWVKGESYKTWQLAEDCFNRSYGQATRYLDNPHLANNGGFTPDDDPDHYSERYLGAGDNGGVHHNSGIPNKAFYLVAKGGGHHLGGCMTGIGADDASKIWYRALVFYLGASSNFLNARRATVQAAMDLFGAGSTQAKAVTNAWSLVGVIDPAIPPTLSAGTASLSFTATQGGSNPPSQSLGIINIGTGNLSTKITTSATWLKVPA